MSKSKSVAKAAKPTKPEALSKVKDAGVTKPAQTVKAKSKDLAKNVAQKENKKNKNKKVKEPTPEPSSDSEEADSSDNDSDSESESDAEVKKPVANGKANGKAKVAAHDSSDDSGSDDSDSSASSDDDKVPAKVNGSSKITADEDSDSDESDSSDDAATPAVANKTAPTADSEDESDSDDSASDNEAEDKPAKKTAAAQDSDDDSDDSDSADDESEEQSKVETKVVKRKAEDSPAPVAKKNKNENTEAPGGKNLFVGNLSWNVDEGWLRAEFEEYGELSGARLITDRGTGRSKGFGYVEFVNAEDAAKAHAAKNGVELDGRAMNVDFATEKPSDGQRQERTVERRKSYGDQLGEPTDTLFVGNLSFDAGQEEVSEAFSAFGTILGVRLPTDRETGAPKGFGYVNFSTVEEATAALEAMQGEYVGSRAIRLDYSQPRPANNDSPGRGRGGRGGGFGGRGGNSFGGRGAGFGGRGGSRGGRGGSFGNSRGGRGGARGGSTNRGGFGDFSGSKRSFDD